RRRTGAQSKPSGAGDRFFAALLAACRRAAEAASVGYPQLVYPYLEKEMSLATPISLERLCGLALVSRAGFYRWRDASEAVDRDLDLRDEIQRIALEFPYYGRPRGTRELGDRGWRVNHKRVYRIMREVLCLRRRKFAVVTTDSNHDRPVYPNVAREMAPTGIDQLWVADITYIRLEREFVYLAVILDGHSRRVIGWALDRTLEDELTMGAPYGTGSPLTSTRSG